MRLLRVARQDNRSSLQARSSGDRITLRARSTDGIKALGKETASDRSGEDALRRGFARCCHSGTRPDVPFVRRVIHKGVT